MLSPKFLKLLQVQTLPTKGRGLFSLEPISSSETIFYFGGKHLYQHQLPARHLSDYYLQIGADLYLGPSGEADDLVNHSCQPNSAVIIRNRWQVLLTAISPISPQEEITFDYSLTWSEGPEEALEKCQCGSSSCRGSISSFRFLPEEIKKKYLALGLVPEYAQ